MSTRMAASYFSQASPYLPVPNQYPLQATVSTRRPRHHSDSATVRREIELGNYEIERQRAGVSDYNNPLDALRVELASAEQEKMLEKDERRRLRKARRLERDLAKALERHLMLQEGEERTVSMPRRRIPRKPTPYASAESGSDSSSEDEPRQSRRSSRKHSSRGASRNQSRQASPHPVSSAAQSIREGKKDKARPISQVVQHHDFADHVDARQDMARMPSTSSPAFLLRPPMESQSRDHQRLTASHPHHDAVPTFTLGKVSRSRRNAGADEAQIPHEQTGHAGPLVRAVPMTADPPLLKLVFRDTRKEYILTRSQIYREAVNSFSKALERSAAPQGQAGRLLTVPIPADRSSVYFQVIFAYLSGTEVVPLSESHSRIICSDYPPTPLAYNRLKEQALDYGLYMLFDQIGRYQDSISPEDRILGEAFRLFDIERGFPVQPSNLNFSRRSNLNPMVGLPTMRAAMTGVSINFMGVLASSEHGKEAFLHYRLVASSTPLSDALNELLNWDQPDLSDGLELCGSLSQYECQQVIFDITSKTRATLAGPSTSHSPKVRVRPSTLKDVMQELHPHHLDGPSDISSKTFTIFDLPPVARRKNDPEQEKYSKYFYNLPYATVYARIIFPKSELEQPRVELEQIHAYTKDLLKSSIDTT